MIASPTAYINCRPKFTKWKLLYFKTFLKYLPQYKKVNVSKWNKLMLGICYGAYIMTKQQFLFLEYLLTWLKQFRELDPIDYTKFLWIPFLHSK